MNFDEKAKDWDNDPKKVGFECIVDKIILSIIREPGGVKRDYPLFMLALRKN